MFTLITVTLTINQLASSRVFGSPNTLSGEFEGGKDVRAGRGDRRGETSPVSTAEFISFVGSTLLDRARAFRAAAAPDSHVADAGADEHGSWVETYAERIEAVSESMRPVDVIAATAGSDYARHIRDAEALGRANTDRLPEPVREELEAIGELLEALSISRQYYKTIHLHQGFAQLTRNLVYVGLPAALVAVYVPLVYESGGTTTVPPRHLPVVVGAAVVLAPLALLLVHLLRITSVMRYTVSVGPFTPPREWPWAE